MEKNTSWQRDLSAGLVVFLVALPLCLGIGLASTNIQGIIGLPSLFSGLIAGIVGGIVVGVISGSRLGVSGPAAGLITIVLASISTLGSFEAFLLAVCISGLIQIIAGLLKFGVIANYIPSAVIKGMLAAIGITLILKELPHLVGYDADFFGDEAFEQTDGHNTFSELFYSINALHLGATIIGLFSLIGILLYDKHIAKKGFFKWIPGALIFVVIGALVNMFLFKGDTNLYVDEKHLVQIPSINGPSEFIAQLAFPDFSFIQNPDVYVIAFTLAIVGSLETLLSVEATDKLDPDKNTTPPNRELVGQGIGNLVSGLIGGLPITQVIVRSSANINAGGKSKIATIFHGILLLFAVMFLVNLLNTIPLSVLAAILVLIGYKLASFEVINKMYHSGWDQFIPFVFTILGVLLTDLLKGIAIGFAVAVFYILKRNYKNNFDKTKLNDEIVITLSEEVTFLNKGGIQQTLLSIPEKSKVLIDGSRCKNIDHDVLEVIEEFKRHKAQLKQIEIRLINL